MSTVPSRALATHAELADRWRTKAALARHDGRLPGITDELRARLRQRAELWAARAAALELRMRESRGRR